MKQLLAAISMLSILPVGRFQPTEADLRRSLDWFPVAGLVFGALFYGLGRLVEPLPPILAAMVLALAPEVLTKGFHLDGLADTADGFLSGRPRERKLEIMRDSHLGSMGAAAIFAVLGLRFALYASLPAAWLAPAAAMAALTARSGMVWYIAFSRYARPAGLGALWFGRKPWIGMAAGLLLVLAAGALWFDYSGFLFAPAMVVFAGLWSLCTRLVIGGATGDTIGSAEELTELLALALAAGSVSGTH